MIGDILQIPIIVMHAQTNKKLLLHKRSSDPLNLPMTHKFLYKGSSMTPKNSALAETLPDPGYQWESDKLKGTTNKSQEVCPFPAGDHKVQINGSPQRHTLPPAYLSFSKSRGNAGNAHCIFNANSKQPVAARYG